MAVTLINTVLIFQSSSAIFLIIGLFTPGWLVMEQTNYKMETGLFFTKLCIEGKCSSLTQRPGAQEKLIAECKALTISALIFNVISVILVFVVKRTEKKYMAVLLVAATFLSGLLVDIAIGRFSREIIHGVNVLTQSTGSHPFKFPYSILIAGIGGALATLSAIMTAIHIYVTHYKNDNSPTKITMPELRFHDGENGGHRQEEVSHDSDRDHVIDADDKLVLV